VVRHLSKARFSSGNSGQRISCLVQISLQLELARFCPTSASALAVLRSAASAPPSSRPQTLHRIRPEARSACSCASLWGQQMRQQCQLRGLESVSCSRQLLKLASFSSAKLPHLRALPSAVRLPLWLCQRALGLLRSTARAFKPSACARHTSSSPKHSGLRVLSAASSRAASLFKITDSALTPLETAASSAISACRRTHASSGSLRTRLDLRNALTRLPAMSPVIHISAQALHSALRSPHVPHAPEHTLPAPSPRRLQPRRLRFFKSPHCAFTPSRRRQALPCSACSRTHASRQPAHGASTCATSLTALPAMSPCHPYHRAGAPALPSRLAHTGLQCSGATTLCRAVSAPPPAVPPAFQITDLPAVHSGHAPRLIKLLGCAVASDASTFPRSARAIARSGFFALGHLCSCADSSAIWVLMRRYAVPCSLRDSSSLTASPFCAGACSAQSAFELFFGDAGESLFRLSCFAIACGFYASANVAVSDLIRFSCPPQPALPKCKASRIDLLPDSDPSALWDPPWASPLVAQRFKYCICIAHHAGTAQLCRVLPSGSTKMAQLGRERKSYDMAAARLNQKRGKHIRSFLEPASDATSQNRIKL